MGNSDSKPSDSSKNTGNDKNSTKDNKANDEQQSSEIDIDSLPEYTMEDVEKHDSKEKGVWIVLNNLVYDVTPFLPLHPGGAGFLLEVAGEDATQEFEAAIHSESARMKAKEFLIGKLKKDKTKKQGLSLPTSMGAPQNNKPPSKYPPSSNNQNKSNNSSSSKQGKSKQIKFTNMSYENEEAKKDIDRDILLLYGTQKGTSKQFTEILHSELSEKYKEQNKQIIIKNMKDFDAEDLEKESIVIMLTSTYENGEPPIDAKFFISWIKEAPSDCRVHDLFLRNVRIAVFGLGNSLYQDNYNKVSRTLYNNLLLLGATPLLPLGLGDANVSRDDNCDLTKDFDEWKKKLLPHIDKALKDSKYPKSIAVKKNNKPTKFRKDIKFEEVKYDDDEHGLADMEDIGNMMKNGMKMKKAKSATETKDNDNDEVVKKKMVTDRIRESLTKQGYKVIGSHSGVKLCRWTKSMLRGRGGCYKNTFYGIKSYQCMEMTPSLACANKCVFCWRHHTNPVGKEWKWVTDEPEFILNKAIENHKQMVKAMKGVPGVIQERLDEAQERIRHCALSLVGEPIMYPFINEYLNLLHSKHISSFLVTNAQFPERIKNSQYITQLYVSVDAATKDSLKSIDRPLFKDYWERFLQSLDNLKVKKQRTVYRLTLVKAWNVGEIADYARLIARGLPTFIEVKGVTFCGKSDGSNLTMNNVPFHFEVIRFCEKLCEYLSSDYEIACEHAHSCCVLIAKKDLKVDGKWYTHIDYDKFFELLESGQEFGYKDYMAETPSWAVIGANEQGFNPKETKFVKQRSKNNRQQKNMILQQKIEKAKQEIEEERKASEKILPQNNPYLIGKQANQQQSNDNCNDHDCNCQKV